jgi:tetratricopeptide (TPR) repeat protein
VRQLTGARGDLYDYLAEEVMAGLPIELQNFLMRVSLLEYVDARTATAASDWHPDEVTRLIDEGEHVGLLARSDRVSPHRFHPLVRDFLQSRLEADVGPAGVRTIHRRIAASLEREDWQLAASHYRIAGEYGSAERVIDASVDQILASGQFEQVRTFLDGSVGRPDRPAALVLRSRVEFARGDLHKATALAEAAVVAARATNLAGLALLNLASVLGVAGFADEAKGLAAEALRHTLTPAQRYVAEATVAMWEASNEGDLAAIGDGLRQLAVRQDLEDHPRYASITRLNLSSVLLWEGRPKEALEAATEAEAGFAQLGLHGVERVSAMAARATALAHLGQHEDAERVLTQAASASSVLARDEAVLETAKVLGDFGGLREAEAALDRAGPAVLATGSYAGLWFLVSGQLALRRGDLDAATELSTQLPTVPCRDVAGKLRAQLLHARVALATNSVDAQREAEELRRIARVQQSRPGVLLETCCLA